MIAVKVHDAPKSSSSSSALSGLPQHSCSRCFDRMSSFDRDIHLFCTRCQNYKCSVALTYEEYESWSQEEILAHEKYRYRLLQNLRAGVKVWLSLEITCLSS